MVRWQSQAKVQRATRTQVNDASPGELQARECVRQVHRVADRPGPTIEGYRVTGQLSVSNAWISNSSSRRGLRSRPPGTHANSVVTGLRQQPLSSSASGDKFHRLVGLARHVQQASVPVLPAVLAGQQLEFSADLDEAR